MGRDAVVVDRVPADVNDRKDCKSKRGVLGLSVWAKRDVRCLCGCEEGALPGKNSVGKE